MLLLVLFTIGVRITVKLPVRLAVALSNSSKRVNQSNLILGIPNYTTSKLGPPVSLDSNFVFYNGKKPIEGFDCRAPAYVADRHGH